MKNIITIFIGTSLLMLTACFEAKPVSTSSTNNPEVNLALLFEHDGCKIFRFEDDGRYHYYTVCREAKDTNTTSSWNEPCGKNCTYTLHEEIDTTKSK